MNPDLLIIKQTDENDYDLTLEISDSTITGTLKARQDLESGNITNTITLIDAERDNNVQVTQDSTPSGNFYVDLFACLSVAMTALIARNAEKQNQETSKS